MGSPNSSSGSSAEYSATETGRDGSKTLSDANSLGRYDILTFLAQFTSVLGYAPKSPEQMCLLMIFLDDLTYQIPRESGSGGTSRVVLVKSQSVMERSMYTSNKPILPDVIAMKMTKPSALKGETRVDLALLWSMSTELRILSDATIRSHDNIITLIGTCWQRIDEGQNVLLPVFVYDASELGDLRKWLLPNKDVTLGVQLDLCLGIARGLACLHEAGVVHCDIKPENVLVFRQDDPECPFVPKIIDFNIAIMFQDVLQETVPLPEGTSPWNSPEQMTSTFIPKELLPKVDVYSLGVLILNILTVDSAKLLLDLIAIRGVQGLSLLEFKRSGSLALNAGGFLGHYGLVSGPEGDISDFPDFRRCWTRANLLLCGALDGDLQDRTNSVAEVADALQGICTDAREHNLRGYTNPNLHILTGKSDSVTLSMAVNKGKLLKTTNFILANNA